MQIHTLTCCERDLNPAPFEIFQNASVAITHLQVFQGFQKLQLLDLLLIFGLDPENLVPAINQSLQNHSQKGARVNWFVPGIANSVLIAR